MKSICKILLLCILLLLIPYNNTYAQTYKSFEVTDVSDQQYELILKATNKFDGSTIICEGMLLKNIRITSLSKYKGEFVIGNVQWNNPEYIITIGEQITSATFYCNQTQETVIVNVYIYGIPDPYYNMKNVSKSQTESKEPVHGGKSVKDLLTVGVIGCGIESIITPLDMIFYDKDNKIVLGTVIYTNFNNLKKGLQEVTWTFTPNDKSYETKIGYIEVKLVDIEKTDNITSLTVNTLLLSASDSTYDININNKPSGKNTYSWKSSNTKVATVSKIGLVNPVSDGEAEISCIITDSSGEITELTSTVKVGTDDNFPMLSDEDIIIDIGDTYKLKVENKEIGSTVKFVSSDKAILKISTSGKMTAIKEGICVVTVIITKETEAIVLNCNVSIE